MTQEELELLASGAFDSVIRENLDKDPAAFALSHREKNFPTALLATQLKYLQKSAIKHPSFYAQGCIMLPRAYEQSSSELVARNRGFQGRRCLDLTCGMGVDSFYLAKKFEKIHALEPDPLLRRVAEANYVKLGVKNVTLWEQRAEAFVSTLTPNSYDLIFVDPDRRDVHGKRVNDLALGSPNVLELLPRLLEISPAVFVKASPLWDLAAARQVFPGLFRVVVPSVRNEVKELGLEIHREDSFQEIEVQILREQENSRYVFTPGHVVSELRELPATPAYLYEPDVAFYKVRSTVPLFSQYFPALPGGMNHPEGYFFSNTLIEPDEFPGRVFRIVRELSPKVDRVKKYIKTEGLTHLHVSKRYFPEKAVKISRQLSAKSGGTDYLLFTEFPGRSYKAFHAVRLQ